MSAQRGSGEGYGAQSTIKTNFGGIQNAEGGLYFKLNINMSICESQKIILE